MLVHEDDMEQWANLTKMETSNTEKLVSTILYMGALIIAGLVGNTIVVLVYTVRIRTGSTRIFILALAIIDVLNNIFGMSGEIIDIVHTFTFTSTVMCKIIRFNNYITVFSSIYTLIAVAIDRHRKVCFPHSRQITEKGAKLMVGSAVFAALSITIPALILNGVHEYKFHDVVVYECSFQNAYEGTPYPAILVGVQFLIFVAAVVILMVLYCMIGREVFIHSKFSFKKMSAEKKRLKEAAAGTKAARDVVSAGGKSVTFGNVNVTSIEDSGDQIVDDSVVEISEMPSDADQPTIVASNNFRYSIQINKQRKREKAKKIKNKTTLMLVAITVVFILSCLPYLTVSVLKRVRADFVESLSETGYKVYNILLRSYFVNSAANPIVYSFFNSRFRKEVARVICPCRQ